LTTLAQASVLLALSVAPAAAGPIGIVDDFNTAGLGEYTQTAVLDNGAAESNVSFSDGSGALVASYAGTVNQPEQVVFLRDDATLGVGEKLVADVSMAALASQMDFGIAVSATKTPTAASAGDTDTRDSFNWASVSVRPSQNAIRVNSSINGVVTTGSGVLAADEALVNRLFIQRLSSTSFKVGYVDTSEVTFDALTINFTTNDVGSAIGFYADLRAAGGTLGSLDNLRIVPEPAAGLMALMGIIGLVSLRKRA
jgi:hypothetical protein